uniref:Transposase, mutator type n=1 Tax=Tanacetum cinerariifolium TaxID=118510 RepID=A0A699H736_TANCI|nr:transposase, mutator type [Tanacetum cinerariifolium]
MSCDIYRRHDAKDDATDVGNFKSIITPDVLVVDPTELTGGNPKSVTFEIHHDGCFTPTPIDLMYYHFLRPRLGLDYGLHPLNVDADVLEMEKYVKDNKIILMYVEHESSNVDLSVFVTSKKGFAIAVDNHLRKAPIKIDSSLDVNKNLTSMCHRNLTKEWKHVSSKALSIGEVMKILSKKQRASSVKGPIGSYINNTNNIRQHKTR